LKYYCFAKLVYVWSHRLAERAVLSSTCA